MTVQRDAPARAGKRPGRIQVEASILIHAPAERLAALYLDHAHWSRLFPKTIRGVRLVRQSPAETVVEVDDRTAGPVVNVIRPRSAREISLEEFKPTFDATFRNSFEPTPDGTRYRVTADVRLKRPFAVLAPFLHGYVRRSIRRYVLEPMRTYAERESHQHVVDAFG
jgi:hypothetical protein